MFLQMPVASQKTQMRVIDSIWSWIDGRVPLAFVPRLMLTL